MPFWWKWEKFKIFISLGMSGSKAALPICLYNGMSLRFHRYLYDLVVNFSFRSILSIFKLIIRFWNIWSKIAADACRFGLQPRG